jgi:hypothetical protein
LAWIFPFCNGSAASAPIAPRKRWIPIAAAIDSRDVFTPSRQQHLTFDWRRRPHRLKVSTAEPDVRKRSLGTLVKVQKSSRPKLKIRSIAPDIAQPLYPPKSSDPVVLTEFNRSNRVGTIITGRE